MSTPPIHIITPVWGTAYTRCFLDIGLASLLAPGNLPALKPENGNLMHVFTTDTDLPMIEQSEIWQRARAVLDCRIDVIPPAQLHLGQPHTTMSDCHRQAIAFADTRDAAMMFYNPDIVIADGGMRALDRLLSQGKRAIQVMGLRLQKEDVAPQLMERHRQNGGMSVVISPRQLMTMAMPHLHPITKMHLHDAAELDVIPQALIWRVGDEGLIARCFHIHPILVHPRVRNAPFTTTVDDDYLRAACPDPAEEYVVTDSDEFCLCELSSMQHGVHGLPRRNVDLDVAAWAWAHARPHHFEHFCRRILMHTGRKQGDAWQHVGAQSDATVRRVLEELLSREAASTAN